MVVTRDSSLWDGSAFAAEPDEEWPLRQPLTAQALARRAAGTGLVAGGLILFTAANARPLLLFALFPFFGFPALLLAAFLGAAALVSALATPIVGLHALRRSHAPWVVTGVMAGLVAVATSLMLLVVDSPLDWLSLWPPE